MAEFYIKAPAYRMDGREFVLQRENDGAWSDEILRVREQRTYAGDDTLRIEGTWTNIAPAAVDVQLILEAETCFTSGHYVIPCVSYNGNEWGHGGEPKGLTRDGAPWIFAGNRCAIPSCTLSENGNAAFALFAADDTPDSLRSSCSLMRNPDGTMRHRILYPVIEESVSYSGRDEYHPARENTIHLESGESFTAAAYAWSGRPVWKNFGIAALEDAALNILHPVCSIKDEPEKIWQLGISYAERLLTDFNGEKLFSIGCNLERSPVCRFDGNFEAGWCGQNILYARMMLRDYRKTGSRQHLEAACATLKTWSVAAMAPGGLMYVHFQDKYRNEAAYADTCNLGFAIAELAHAARDLREAGICDIADDCANAARAVGDFMVEHYSPEYGFGKLWNIATGEIADRGGTIGAYIIYGLMELYKTCPDAAYLRTAGEALDFYCARDLDNCMTTAGALDTACVDKETSSAIVTGALLLYEATHDARRLEQARKAAYYFCSWMYCYEPYYAPESEFRKYGYRVSGGTSVSVQHHHIDCWGALLVPWLIKLAAYTGDERWHARARLIWSNVTSCIARDGADEYHGRRRPAGGQNEGFLHCAWHLPDWDRPEGQLNDWLVAWPGAYRLYALATVDDTAALAPEEDGAGGR